MKSEQRQKKKTNWKIKLISKQTLYTKKVNLQKTLKKLQKTLSKKIVNNYHPKRRNFLKTLKKKIK